MNDVVGSNFLDSQLEQKMSSTNLGNHLDSQSYLSSQKTQERLYENANNDEEERSGRRLQWTEEDNIRLVRSCFLFRVLLLHDICAYYSCIKHTD